MPVLYDAEQYVQDIYSLFTTNLNTCITAYNTNKNDSITLPTINNYFLEPIINFGNLSAEPFFSYGWINKTMNDPRSGLEPKVISLFFRINLVQNDLTSDPNVLRWLLRYQTVLENVIINGTGKFQGYGIPVIVDSPLAEYELANNLIRSAEISVDFTLG